MTIKRIFSDCPTVTLESIVNDSIAQEVDAYIENLYNCNEVNTATSLVEQKGDAA
ncbi:MAG: hypothetical protein ACRDDX_08360 [Cellulosilyticaceae bacterium]